MDNLHKIRDSFGNHITITVFDFTSTTLLIEVRSPKTQLVATFRIHYPKNVYFSKVLKNYSYDCIILKKQFAPDNLFLYKLNTYNKAKSKWLEIYSQYDITASYCQSKLI